MAQAPRFEAKTSGDGKTLEMHLYGDIGDSGGFFSTPGITAKQVQQALDDAPHAKKVLLRINSPGGDAYEGMTIKNLLQNSGKKVTAHIDGMAASAASLIAAGADKTVMHEGSAQMVHGPRTVTRGNIADHERNIEALKTLHDGMAAAYARKSGKSKEDMKALMDAETWFTPDAAKAAGLCDEVDVPVEGVTAMLARADVERYGYRSVPQQFLAMAEAGDDHLGGAQDPARATEGEEVPAVEVEDDATDEEPVTDPDNEAEAAQASAVPYSPYPTKETSSWDGPAAEKRVRAWATSNGKVDFAKYRKAFAWYDGSKPEEFGSYKLIHHDVDGGKLVTVRGGVIAAGNVMQGSRGGVNIPSGDVGAVKSHLEKHYKQFGLKAPWQPKALEQQPMAQQDTPSETEGSEQDKAERLAAIEARAQENGMKAVLDRLQAVEKQLADRDERDANAIRVANEKRVDSMIASGAIKPDEKDDALFLLTEAPERFERIYGARTGLAKPVPVGVHQAGPERRAPGSTTPTASTTDADVSDFSAEERAAFDQLVAINKYPADKAAERIRGVRRASAN